MNKRFQHISAEEASNTRPNHRPQMFSQNAAVSKKNDNFSKKKAKSFSCQTVPQNSTKCIFCNSTQHFVATCPSFSALPVQQRFEFVKGVPACINCLKKGHTVTKCKSSKCRVCSRSHNTLLHIYAANDAQVQSGSSSDPMPSISTVL